MDGRYVFCHVYQNLNDGAAEWVTADLFDTDENDRMIEHWDVIQAFVEPTASGRSMIDGPSEVENLDNIEDTLKNELEERARKGILDLLGGN